MVTLSLKENRRLMVLNDVERRAITGRQAAEMVELSLRQVRRLLAVYRKEGAAGLAHGNRGRKPRHALAAGLKCRVLELARSRYTGCNTQHMSELLDEREGITISRSSVRRILLEAGIRSPRKRKAPRHRSRRERYLQEGMLLQIDGSHHKWLEDRGPALVLVGAIDDATGKVPHGLFREEEDALGYFQLLKQVVTKYGVPRAVYHDGHGVFERSEYEPETLEEQLQGRKHATQFGRLLQELGIASIRSRSPQARGRIERLWGTFQDRLVSELRLSGASTIEEANRVLQDYLPRHNQKFAIAAAEPGSAFRTPERDLADVFCFKYQRTAGLDNVVRFSPCRLQVLPSHGRYSYARTRVEVRQSLDGSLAVYYQDKRLNTRPAPDEATVLRKAASQPPSAPGGPAQRHYAKPAPDHPWRGKFRVHIDRG
jgi:transposase